jgi:DNA polymerase I-like protein with 3'-5' exonuclease and polymerase domains
MVFKGRVFSTYKTMVDTGRFANRGNGTRTLKLNAPTLTFPNNEKTRAMFQSPEGWRMIVCDYDGQENTVGADLHGCPTMRASILNGACLHCAFARLIYPELSGMSDSEIKSKYSKKRSFAKSPRFAFAYGGSAYTIAPVVGGIEEGERLEKLFKEELHADIYRWGNTNLKKALSVGYIESVEGFRLKLPFFDRYKRLEQECSDVPKKQWTLYKLGKREYQKVKEAEGDDSVVEDWEAYTVFKKLSPKVRSLSKLRSNYSRLCLNNPIQSTSAFQTKRALWKLWDEILERGWVGEVLICVAPHDEIVLECKEHLSKEVALLLEKCMKGGGDYYLNTDLSMSCTADIEYDWYGAKKTN